VYHIFTFLLEEAKNALPSHAAFHSLTMVTLFGDVVARKGIDIVVAMALE
jgi:hypothetical protein